MAPEAPGWLTTTTSTPSASARIGAVTRVTWSVEPPAPQGTIRLIGRSGFHSWAKAIEVPSVKRAVPDARTSRRDCFIVIPPIFGARFSGPLTKSWDRILQDCQAEVTRWLGCVWAAQLLRPCRHGAKKSLLSSRYFNELDCAGERSARWNLISPGWRSSLPLLVPV